MLIETLVGGVLGVLRGLMELTPAWDVTVDVTGGGLLLAYGTLNTALPLEEMVLLVGVTLAFTLTAMPFYAAIYVYKLLPFKAS